MKVIEQWQSMGRPGLYEVLVELDREQPLPKPGGSLSLPGLGEVNVETVFRRVALPASSDPVLIRMDVWQTPSPYPR